MECCVEPLQIASIHSCLVNNKTNRLVRGGYCAYSKLAVSSINPKTTTLAFALAFK